jgi:hypothetical protein
VKKDPKEVVVVAGDAQVSLAFSPFKLSVIVKGKQAVTLNGKGLFDFEHTRVKEVRPDVPYFSCILRRDDRCLMPVPPCSRGNDTVITAGWC